MTKVSLYGNQHSYVPKNKDKKAKKNPQEVMLKKMEQAKDVTLQLHKYVQSPEFQSALERMPEQDALFIRDYDTQIQANGKIKMINPQLVYCKDYYKKNSVIDDENTKNMEIKISKGIDENKILSWLKKIIN